MQARPAGACHPVDCKHRSVEQVVGADSLPLGLLVLGKHPAKELAGALDPADHPRLQGVGEDGGMARPATRGPPW